MKNKMNAIEMKLPEGTEPLAYAGSGCLRAILWKSDVGCHFFICREDPDTGEFDTAIHASDTEHLAKLTAIVANALHYFGNANDDLNHDLGCLAHCLGQTLGIEFDDIGMPKRMTVQ